jgi:hypothetical protein
MWWRAAQWWCGSPPGGNYQFMRNGSGFLPALMLRARKERNSTP